RAATPARRQPCSGRSGCWGRFAPPALRAGAGSFAETRPGGGNAVTKTTSVTSPSQRTVCCAGNGHRPVRADREQPAVPNGYGVAGAGDRAARPEFVLVRSRKSGLDL